MNYDVNTIHKLAIRMPSHLIYLPFTQSSEIGCFFYSALYCVFSMALKSSHGYAPVISELL